MEPHTFDSENYEEALDEPKAKDFRFPWDEDEPDEDERDFRFPWDLRSPRNDLDDIRDLRSLRKDLDDIRIYGFPLDFMSPLRDWADNIRTSNSPLRYWADDITTSNSFLQTTKSSSDDYVPSSLEAMLQDSSRPHAISLQHLKQITGNFSEERILRKGGFGVVYKGLFQNGDMIAVKKIMSSLIPGLQKQFENEVYHLMTLKHPNIVRCVGYCYEIKNACVEYDGKYVFAEMAEKLLCLEYLPKGSLDKYLSDESSGFDWSTRYKIIEGICYGLLYLHEKIGQPIIHLDLKPANILLDDGFVPKITDFGLSRQLDQLQTISTSTYDGTFGYMAPEFLHRGTITPKSDIFSLGVIIMEVVTGHRDYPDVTRESLDNYIELALQKWRDVLQRLPEYGSLETDCKGQAPAGSGYFGSLVRSLSMPFKWLFSGREPVTSCSKCLETDCEQIKRCIQIGLICVNHDRKRRPPITKVISMLQGSDIIDDDIGNDEA